MSEDLGETWAIDIGNWWSNIAVEDALRARHIPWQKKSELTALAATDGDGEWLTTPDLEDAVWGADFDGIGRKNDDGAWEKKAEWKQCWGL